MTRREKLKRNYCFYTEVEDGKLVNHAYFFDWVERDHKENGPEQNGFFTYSDSWLLLDIVYDTSHFLCPDII